MALLLAHLWHQISHDAQSRGGASSAQLSNINMVVPQTRDVCLDLGGNMLLQGHLDMFLCSSMGKDLAMLPGDNISYSHPAVPHQPPFSCSFSLHCAHTLLILFLFYLSTPYLFILVSRGTCGCLRSSQECCAPPLPDGAGQRSYLTCSLPGSRAPDWWLSAEVSNFECEIYRRSKWGKVP
jgi:hypothetical protein